MKQLFQSISDLKVIIRLVNIVLVILAAYFCATLIMVKFENAMQAQSPRQVRAISTYSSSRPQQPLTVFNPILQRNIFNSQMGELMSFDESDNGSSLQGIKDNPAELSGPSSVSEILLRGTLCTTPEDSMAVFELKSSRKQILVKTGSEIINGVYLHSVQPLSVSIKRLGKLEEIQLYVEKPRDMTNLNMTAQRTDGIRQNDKNRFEIDKETLNKNLDNVNEIISQIAMRPKMESGVCVGYEIRRIKEGSIFQDIGLLQGDVLQRVNGMDLSNPEDAFRVYKSLIGETSFNIELLRDGQRTSLNYEIR